MSLARSLTFLLLAIFVGGCTAHPTLDVGSFHASPIPGVRFRVEVFAYPAPSPGTSRCCRVVTENPSSQAVYGLTCHLEVFDAKGHRLYDGPLAASPGGLYAPAGRHRWGYVRLPVRHPGTMRSSKGSCDAWSWGSNGPPP